MKVFIKMKVINIAVSGVHDFIDPRSNGMLWVVGGCKQNEGVWV